MNKHHLSLSIWLSRQISITERKCATKAYRHREDRTPKALEGARLLQMVLLTRGIVEVFTKMFD